MQLEDVNTNPRKRVATELLRIEKKILGNALAAVQELIGELPSDTVAPCSGRYVPGLR